MIRQTPGKIFLAEQRGLQENEHFRRYSTFSFEGYSAAHKGSFGSLYGCNEETLAASHTLALVAYESAHVLLLPVTGRVSCRANQEPALAVEVEEVLLLTVPANTTLHFTNPYDSELISFLHLWIRAEPPAAACRTHLVAFDFLTIENQLARLISGQATVPALPFSLYLGRFAGRRETLYRLRSPESRFFGFVLSGAFEVEGRLLHEKDGLALWNAEEVELEALSNNALLVVLEF